LDYPFGHPFGRSWSGFASLLLLGMTHHVPGTQDFRAGPMTLEELHHGLTASFRAFMAEYAEFGGHRFHGFTDYGDPRNYQGPLIWSEGDCQFRFALELERFFPGMVHLSFPSRSTPAMTTSPSGTSVSSSTSSSRT
jgi:hypothetical protein